MPPHPTPISAAVNPAVAMIGVVKPLGQSTRSGEKRAPAQRASIGSALLDVLMGEGEIGIGMHGGELLPHLGGLLRHPSRSAVRFRSFQRNLFARRRADGTEQTVAVDWAFTGIGAVGAELAPLVIGSLLLFQVAVGPPRDVVETVLTGCLAGLREAG